MGERDWRLEASLVPELRAACPICDAESEIGEVLGATFWLCPAHGMVFADSPGPGEVTSDSRA